MDISEFFLVCLLTALPPGTRFEEILLTTHCFLPKLIERKVKSGHEITPPGGSPHLIPVGTFMRYFYFTRVWLSFSFSGEETGFKLPNTFPMSLLVVNSTYGLRPQSGWSESSQLPSYTIEKKLSHAGKNLCPWNLKTILTPHPSILKYSFSLTRSPFLKITLSSF